MTVQEENTVKQDALGPRTVAPAVYTAGVVVAALVTAALIELLRTLIPI